MKRIALAMLLLPLAAQADSDWRNFKNVNPFTDTVDELSYVGSDRDTLYVKCINNKPIVTFKSKEYITDKSQFISYRVDKGPIRKVLGAGVVGGESLIIEEGDKLVADMYGADKLYIKFKNYTGKSYMARLHISGADNALLFYAKCGMNK